MGKLFNSLEQSHKEFILQQHMFFVATAPTSGRLNLSPKGMDSFRILGDNQVCWLNYTGSSNETAGHLLQDPRMTLMFCSFTGPALILRLYGVAECIYPTHPRWNQLSHLFQDTMNPSFAHRQIFDVKVESVQSSCGFGVPMYDFVRQRTEILKWAEAKGDQGVRKYWSEKNSVTIDGHPTGLNKLPK